MALAINKFNNLLATQVLRRKTRLLKRYLTLGLTSESKSCLSQECSNTDHLETVHKRKIGPIEQSNVTTY